MAPGSIPGQIDLSHREKCYEPARVFEEARPLETVPPVKSVSGVLPVSSPAVEWPFHGWPGGLCWSGNRGFASGAGGPVLKLPALLLRGIR